MSLFVLISILVTIAMIALVVSALAQKKSEARHKEKKICLQLRQYLQDAEDVLDVLISYDNNPDIKIHITRYIIQQLEKLGRIDPDATNTAAIISHHEAQIDQYQQEAHQECASPTIQNDSQIKYIRRLFGVAARILKYLETKGMLSKHEITQSKQHLHWRLLQVEVDAYVAYGHKAAKKGDRLTASGYYKFAKDMLIKYEHSYAEKSEQIKKISKMISGLYENSELDTESIGINKLSDGLDNEKPNVDNMGFPLDANAERKHF